MAHPSDADAWQRQYEGKLAEIERRNEQMSEELERLQITERSSDGKVSVTVNSQGNLTDLVLGDSLRQRGGQEVAAEVLRLVSVAQGRIADQVRETMQPYLAGSEVLEHVLGKVRSAPQGAGAQPPSSPAPSRRSYPDDDDDDWENGSFLR